jgi:hypothetical protein
MAKSIWEQCRMVKLTTAQFEELLTQGWPYDEPGAARLMLEPTTAQKLLTRMKRNRPEKPRNQVKLQAAMLRGYFRENGEPIILNARLEPIDGQNRLKACVRTRTAIPVVIEWGWTDECFDTIDTGVKRSGGDMFSADGESNAVLLSAAVRYDWRITHKDMLSGNQVAEPLMRDYLKQHDGLHAACTWANKVHHLIPKGMAVALFYRFSQKDPGLAKQFFQDLAKGENINSREHTAWHLRDLLLTRQGEHLQLSCQVQAQIAANVIKAWNSYREGKVLTRARLSWRGEGEHPEPFPEIG